MDTPIITLHDIDDIPVLININQISCVRQAETYCIVYFGNNLSIKVKETLNDIGKCVNAKKYIG